MNKCLLPSVNPEEKGCQPMSHKDNKSYPNGKKYIGIKKNVIRKKILHNHTPKPTNPFIEALEMNYTNK